MDSIEDIWSKGNEPIGSDESFTSDAVLRSISENSKGISAKLLQSLWFGAGLAALAALMFILNIFFYSANLAMLLPIIVCLIAAVVVSVCLFSQIGVVRKMDTLDLNLHQLLVYKIKYLNKRFKLAMHAVSLSVVLATFTINLTMESGDGIFELRKILILLLFYLFTYVVTFSLSSLTLRVYNKQLQKALHDLEENAASSMDKELKRYKKIGRIIALVLAVIAIAGLVALLLHI